jgi:hypothetical protein
MEVKSKLLIFTDKVYFNTFWPKSTRIRHFGVYDHKIRYF